MLYHIAYLCPRPEKMSGCGFHVQLWPAWKEAVQASSITQKYVDGVIGGMHRPWLDGCGYDAIYDPAEDPLDRWKTEKMGAKRKLSKEARPLYDRYSIRVAWGRWGPEHITVPGNACGLDLSNSLGLPNYCRELTPHNVDNRNQALLLLVVFTYFADAIIHKSGRGL